MQLRVLFFLLFCLSSARAAIIGVPVTTGRYFDPSDPDAEFRINVSWSLLPPTNDRFYPGGLYVWASNFPDVDHVRAGWNVAAGAFGYPDLHGQGQANINFLTNTAELVSETLDYNTLDYFSYEVIEPGQSMTLVWSNTAPREAAVPEGGSSTVLFGIAISAVSLGRRMTKRKVMAVAPR